VDVTIADDARGIVLSHLTKSFGRSGVRSIDLTIATGEIVALLGPTAPARPRHRHVLGLSQPDKGSVTLFA